MSLMQEAITKEDWERKEKGLPPIKIKKIHRAEPEKPVIENEIKFDDIPINDFMELESAVRKTLKNVEGISFLGYDVKIILNPNAQLKRKAGRPSKEEKEEISTEPKVLSGWMNEGDFLKFRRILGKKINPQVINW